MFPLSRVAAVLVLCSAPIARAADDPTIENPLRQEIQTAMQRFVEENSVAGVYRHFDPVEGRLLELELKELHAGIVRKGSFYVSCADFLDPNGGVVDLDFLVLETPTGPRVTQAIVHKADGTKRPYHLESQEPSSSER